MLVDPDEHPSFYKFLFKEGFVDKLLMPHAFIKENKNMLGKTCLLRTNEKVFWKAKIVREKSNYFICEAEWAQFVVHHKLELGDILLFVLIDKSTFQVLPYQRKLDKTLSGEELSSSSEEEAEERTNEDEGEEEPEVDPEEEDVQEAEDVGEEKEDVEGEDEDRGERAKEDEGEEEEIRPSRKSKKHKLQGVEASDNFEGEDIVSSEKSKKCKTQIIPWEKVIGPSSGTEDGDSPCYSHSGFIMRGGKSYTEAKSIVLVNKEAPELKRRSKLKDPEEEDAQEAEDVGEEKEDVEGEGEDEDKRERAKEDEGEEDEIRPSRKSKKHKLQGVEASDNFEGEDIVSSEKLKKYKTQIIPWKKVIGPSSGSEDGDSPCYSHSGGKSYTEAKSIVLVKKEAPELKRRSKLKDPEEEDAQEAEDVGEEKEDVEGEDEDKGERAKEDEGEEDEIRPSRKSKKHKLQGVEASDIFEGEDIVPSEKLKKYKTQMIPWKKVIGPSSGSEDGDSPCYSYSGGKSYTEAKSIFLVKKKAPGLKRRSKLKDPNKPKHPVPPFLVFMEEFRKEFKKKNPGCRNAVVGSAAGNKWRQFSEAEKAPYVAETEKRKAEYRKNMMAYWKKQMVCASSKGEESNKSSSEVDDEKEGS